MLDFLKNMFGKGKKVDMPNPADGIGGVVDKVQDAVAGNVDSINKAADSLQEKIPGQMDDKIIDAVQDKVNDFASGQSSSQNVVSDGSDSAQQTPPSNPTV